MVAKAGLGLVGISAIGVGGVALAKPHLLGMDYMPNTFHALSKDSDYGDKKSSDYKNENFGGKYRNYLVGVTNKTAGKEETSNKAWWEWAYRKLQSDGIEEGKFKVKGSGDKKVDKPYGGDSDDKALNQVCKAAYKTTVTNVGNSEDNGKFKKDKVWKYCSPLGKEPSEVKTGDYPGNIGNEADAKFISTKDDSNALFWFIRDKEIRGGDNFEKIAPSGASSDASAHFKKQDKTLKELCEDAYKTKKTDNGSTPAGSPTTEETKKYCVFEIPGMTS